MSSVDPQAATPSSSPPAPSEGPPTPPEGDLSALIARYDREARALGNVPQAAPLIHEMGQLWEAQKSPRNASLCYENALRLDPAYVPNLRSARRLFAEVGNWQLVLSLLESEIAATPDATARAGLRYELGQLLDERLGRPDEALESYERGLQESPADLAILAQLETMYAARNQDAKLLATYAQLAEVVGDERLRAHYLFCASTLCEDRLNMDPEAGELLERAFALRRRDPVLLAAVKRRAERSGSSESLLKALAAEAEGLGVQAGPAYYRISRIYEGLSRPEDAIGALQAARRAAPQDALVLSELARLFETFGRWEELAEVLGARVQVLADEAEKVALQMRLGALCEERLKRVEEAVAHYQGVLALQPGHQLALTALGKLHFRGGDWARLLGIYEREAATTDDPKLRAAPLFKAAELLELRLGREEEAMTRYNELLQLVAGYLPAQKALARLYEKHQRWAELAAMYEQEVGSTRDRDQVISTLNQVSQIYEEHLQDLDRAAGALRRVLEVAPEHLPTIRALSRLYERAGKWAELIQMNDLESSSTGDTKQIVSLCHRNAEIHEEKLAQAEDAIDCYKKVLALSPAYLPALRALGRLYGQRGRWDDLIQMYRQEADIAPSIEQAAVLTFKIGEIYEDKLAHTDNAIAAYQEVLTLAPTHFAALRALSRIHRASGAWESLVEILRHEAAARTDPGERANTLFQVAAIWEDAGKLEPAIEAYQEVLRLSPAHATSLRALERIYVQRGTPAELVALYERETQSVSSPDDRVAAYAKLARLYLFRLDEPARAAACYEQLLAIQPGHLEALKGLERIRGGDRARRLDLRRQLAEQLQAPLVSAQLLASAAQDLERQGQHDEALVLWKRAHALAPGTAQATAGLEAGLSRAQDTGGLSQLLGEQLERETLPAARVSLAMRAGRAAETQGDADRALAFFATALQLSPAFIPALRATRRILVAQGDFRSARAGLHAEAAATRDRVEAVGAWYEAGLIALDRLEDPDGAIADLQKALEIDPLAAQPAAKLEELLARRGGGAALVELQLHRGEAKLAQHAPDEAAKAFLDAARTALTELDDPEQALASVERALVAVPTHPAALTVKGELCFKAGRYEDAVKAFAARIDQQGDRDELATIHLRLGVLYQDHLHEPDRAAAHLQTALAEVPDDVEALERLARIDVAGRNWTAASEVLERLLVLVTEPQALAGHVLALARVHDEGFGDAARAAEGYKRVLELAPGTEGVLDRLALLYEKLGKTPELAAMLEQQSQRAPSPAQAVALRLRAAGLHAKLGDSTRAVATLRFALEADPASIEARSALAGLLAREPSQVTAAIEEYRHLLRLEPFRADAYHALFNLYDQTKQIDRQLCTASMLLFLHQATELESLFVSDAKARAPQDTAEHLNDADRETLLYHPGLRGPLAEALELIGDQLQKLYPADLDAQGLGRGDRLKPDHALGRPVRAICGSLGVEKLEVYQGKRGAQVTVENTDPQSVVIGPDVVRKFQTTRDQRFLFARAALTLRSRSLLAQTLPLAQLEQLIGAALRAVSPEFGRIGLNDPELSKKVRKALPSKVLKALELLVPEIDRGHPEASALVQGAVYSADRAGLVYSGDVAGSLALVLREDPQVTKLESFEQVRGAAASRPEVRELMLFAISDDFFRLRQKLKMSLG